MIPVFTDAMEIIWSTIDALNIDLYMIEVGNIQM